MIRIEHPIDFCDTYGLEQIGALEKLLFFDIETTGFSGNTSQLYLIGCVFFRDGSWHMIQYFADSPQSEREILCEFFEFLEQFEILVHFNGETFDMPYQTRALGDLLELAAERVVDRAAGQIGRASCRERV